MQQNTNTNQTPSSVVTVVTEGYNNNNNNKYYTRNDTKKKMLRVLEVDLQLSTFGYGKNIFRK